MRNVFILSLFFFRAQALHIVVDPGHGGADRGAVYGPAEESKVTLKVAQKLKSELEKKYHHQVTLTRTTDNYLTLHERVQLAEKAQADLFVSLHANAATDPRAKGAEFFFQNPWSNEDEEIQRAIETAELDLQQSQKVDDPGLSKKSQVQSIIQDLYRQNRVYQSLELSLIFNEQIPGHIKQGPFYVIMRTKIPALLVEMGFLTHPRESKKLISDEYQAELAEKMAKSLDIYSARCAAYSAMNNSPSSAGSASVGPCDRIKEKITN